MKKPKRKPVVAYAVVSDCGRVEEYSEFKRESLQHVRDYPAECNHESCGLRSVVRLVEVRR
jgi:hypothetical protein